MTNFNKVILAGNITRDPELSYTASNTAICKFGMAVNRKWRDKNSNENREETCFVDITAFGRTGEVINQYMSKGKPILIEGRLNFSRWEAQDGTKRSKLDVVADKFEFIGGGSGGGPGGGGGGGGGARQAAPARQSAPPMDEDYGPTSGDDVPF